MFFDDSVAGALWDNICFLRLRGLGNYRIYDLLYVVDFLDYVFLVLYISLFGTLCCVVLLLIFSVLRRKRNSLFSSACKLT